MMSEPTQKQKDELARVINQVDLATEILRKIREGMPSKPSSDKEFSHYDMVLLDTYRTINDAIDETGSIGNVPRRYGWIAEKRNW